MSRNPRSEVLIASRHRSGSMANDFDPPPTSPPPPPPDEAEPELPNVLPVYKSEPPPESPGKPQSVSVPSVAVSKTVGSKVSRMKEIFQAANGGSGHEEHKFQPVKTYHHHVARSPPPALMPRSPPPAQSKQSRTGTTTAGSRGKDSASPTESTTVSSLLSVSFIRV